jgi:hypothetical protein
MLWFVLIAAAQVSLSNLRSTDSALIIINCDIAELDLSSLEFVSYFLVIANVDSLTALSLPKLESVGALSIVGNDEVTSLELPALMYVGNEDIDASDFGDVYISSMTSLTYIVLPSLSRCGDLEMYDNYLVEDVEFPVLQSVQSLEMDSMSASSITLPSLTWIGSGGIYVNDMRLLTHLGFPVLAEVVGTITLCGNALLPLPYYFAASVVDSTVCRMSSEFNTCSSSFTACPVDTEPF